jgi:hypothetical protein
MPDAELLSLTQRSRGMRADPVSILEDEGESNQWLICAADGTMHPHGHYTQSRAHLAFGEQLL